jgi:hypothetical protein
MASNKPRLAYIIISDDVREEVGGKFSIMGIYETDVIVPSLPLRFPKLCAYMKWRNVPDKAKVLASIKGPNNEQIAEIGSDKAPSLSISSDQKDATVIYHFFAVQITQEGKHVIELALDKHPGTLTQREFIVKKAAGSP